MLRAIHIANYRSLGDDVSLVLPQGDRSLTVLAGLNGSGKSNALDAVRFLGDVFRQGLDVALRARRGVAALRRRGAEEVRLAVEAEGEIGRVVWGLSLSLDPQGHELSAEWATLIPPDQIAHFEATLRDVALARKGRGDDADRTSVLAEALRWKMDAGDGLRPMPFQGAAVFRPLGPAGPMILPGLPRGGAFLRDLLQRVAVYTLHPPDLREPQEPRLHAPMDGSGADWMSALRALDRAGLRDDFRVMMAKLVPDLVDYRVHEVSDVLITEFVHAGGGGETWALNTRHESDGTLRCAALLAALLQDPLPSLLCIEEPELALHVGALPVLVDQILATASLTPVILTTHSPDVIDLVPADSVRVVERGPHGTALRAVDGRQRRVVRDHLATMGTLLREEGLQAEGSVG